MRKDGILIGLIILILIVGIGLYGYLKVTKKQISANPEISPSQTIAGSATQSVSYFAEDAKVMYFYSDLCHWCQKEKEVLEELGKDGYKVKPMNVGEDAQLWKKYNISGTPTFIAQNNERLVGYQDKEPLKKWLDEHK